MLASCLPLPQEPPNTPGFQLVTAIDGTFGRVNVFPRPSKEREDPKSLALLSPLSLSFFLAGAKKAGMGWSKKKNAAISLHAWLVLLN